MSVKLSVRYKTPRLGLSNDFLPQSLSFRNKMLNLSKSAPVALLVAMGAAAWQDRCESFTATLPNVAIKPTYYPEGALVNLTSPSSMLLSSDLPAFCREFGGLPYPA